MAILKIARMGHPVLKFPAGPVADPGAPEISRLVADMLETLADAGGVGLAAPQVHVPLRLAIFHVPPAADAEARYHDAGLGENDLEVPLTVLINPAIEPLDGGMIEGLEGCLSLPGLSGLVERHARIRYSGLGLDGEAFERTADGFHARVVQHECDHLDGVLFPMRIKDLRKFGFSEELRRGLEGEEPEEVI